MSELERAAAKVKYEMGRALAAIREWKLDVYGTDEAQNAVEAESEIVRSIHESGGWDDEIERGYLDARSEYAKERSGG